MAFWKLFVENYGRIKSAEIEMAPLTLFVGDNNSGKSFLLSLLWGIENLGIETILGYSYVETEEPAVLFSWISKQINITIKNGTHSVSVAEIKEPLEKLLNNGLEKNKNNLVQSIFNSKQISIGKIAIKFCNISDINLVFQVDNSGKLQMSIEDHAGYYGIVENFLNDKSLCMDSYILDFLLKGIYCLIMNIPMHEITTGCIYLPAARTGFMLTKDIINKVGRKNTFNISDDKEIITPFVRPINHFLDIIGDMSLDSLGNDKFLKLALDMEKEMADGAVEINTMPNKEVQYIPNGHKKGIPLRLTSAVVTELSPMILILKHINKIEKFYYEEPEMCLHPQLQHKMGKIICRAVNSGINMIITTHSDIILQHINNMIKSSKCEERIKICEELGYTKQDFLTCEQVKVYQLESRARAKTEVKELLCGEDGFIVPTFNNALNKIMDEAYKIQG